MHFLLKEKLDLTNIKGLKEEAIAYKPEFD